MLNIDEVLYDNLVQTIMNLNYHSELPSYIFIKMLQFNENSEQKTIIF